jgi:hypothetical protein
LRRTPSICFLVLALIAAACSAEPRVAPAFLGAPTANGLAQRAKPSAIGVTIYESDTSENSNCCEIYAFGISNIPIHKITGVGNPPLFANSDGLYAEVPGSGNNDQHVVQFALNANGDDSNGGLDLSDLYCRCKFNGGGLAIDSSGDIWLAGNDDQNGGAATIYKFAPGAKGTPAPLRTITSGLSGLSLAGLAFDASGNLYVGIFTYSSSGAEILRYNKGSSTVTTAIKGANTTLSQVSYVSSFNSSSYGSGGGGTDEIVVADKGAAKIDIWNVSGITNCSCSTYNHAPDHHIGPNSSLPLAGYAPWDVAADAAGDLYATSSGGLDSSPQINEYQAFQYGTGEQPSRVITYSGLHLPLYLTTHSTFSEGPGATPQHSKSRT